MSEPPRASVRSTLLKNRYKSNVRNLYKTDFRATGFSKEGETGVPAFMLKRKDNPDAAFLAYLRLFEIPFEIINKRAGPLIAILNLLESVERHKRKRLQEIPW